MYVEKGSGKGSSNSFLFRLLNVKGSLFVVGLVIFISTYVVSEAFFDDTVPSWLFWLRFFAILLMLLNELSLPVKYGECDYIGVIVIALVSLSSITSGSTSLFLVALVVFFSRNIPFKIIATCCMITVGFWLVVVVGLALAGAHDSNYVLAGGRLRSSLGFTWPSRPQNYFLTFTTLYIILKGDNLKIKHLVLLLIVATFLNYYADARSPYALTLLTLLGAALIRFARIDFTIGLRPLFFRTLFFVLAGTLLIFSAAYNPAFSWMSEINTLLSGRIEYSHNALVQYPITFFGSEVFGNQNLQWFDSYLDSGFLNLLFTYGAVPFFAVMMGLTVVMSRAIKEKYPYIVLSLAILALHSIPEAQLVMLQYTPLLFLIPKALVYSTTLMGEEIENDYGSFKSYDVKNHSSLLNHEKPAYASKRAYSIDEQ